MPRTLDTKCFLDTVCALLQQGQTNVAVPVTGTSMAPFLHNGDTVFLNAPPMQPKKGDVVLYIRKNGDYILHRIVKVHRNGSLTISGDAQQSLEHLPSADCIRGIAVAAKHNDKLITVNSFHWWFYRRVWLWLLPWRHRLITLKNTKK